jgi:predicted DNA-binding transcriptional regulator YafY
MMANVLETSARLLRLLALLQAQQDWQAGELARKLGVSARTVRRDVDRLRALGYPVESTRGIDGGYRLGIGAQLPPLLVDDDEAVALVLGLRSVAVGAAVGTVEGQEEVSLRALAKLERVLPSRLRRRVDAMRGVVMASPGRTAVVSPDTLTDLATACHDHRRVRFDYEDHAGVATSRTVEPHRVVHAARRWYLLGFDVDRDDWRNFRLDRIDRLEVLVRVFEPRPLPEPDVGRHVASGAWGATWRYRTTVTLDAPAVEVAARLPAGVGMVEPLDEHRCTLSTGAEDLDVLCTHLALLGVDFHVTDPPELVERVRRLADRYHRAASPSEP